MEAKYFTNLNKAQFMRLTTYKKNGEPRPTPVWFAEEADRLYVMTGADSYKVRRIRNNPAVLVAPSTAMGKPTGPEVGANARLLAGVEAELAHKRIAKKYGLQFMLMNLGRGARDQERVYLEISQ